MECHTKMAKRRTLSPGALVGFAIAAVAVGWLLYIFMDELAWPPETQRTGEVDISLYPTLTGRPRLGMNQFEVKLRDLRGQPISDADVTVHYSLDGINGVSKIATRSEGYGLFSTVLNFPKAGEWQATVYVRRVRAPELTASFIIRVE